MRGELTHEAAIARVRPGSRGRRRHLAVTAVVAPTAAGAQSNPFERGPAPTATSVLGNGPYSISSANVGLGASGFGGGTIYYPTTTSDGTFGAASSSHRASRRLDVVPVAGPAGGVARLRRLRHRHQQPLRPAGQPGSADPGRARLPDPVEHRAEPHRHLPAGRVRPLDGRRRPWRPPTRGRRSRRPWPSSLALHQDLVPDPGADDDHRRPDRHHRLGGRPLAAVLQQHPGRLQRRRSPCWPARATSPATRTPTGRAGRW